MIGKKLLIWGVLISSFAFFYGLMYHNMNLKLKTVNQEKSQILQQNELLKDNDESALINPDNFTKDTCAGETTEPFATIGLPKSPAPND